MAGATTNFLWPFPTVGDPANVAPDMAALAAAVDGTLGNAETTYSPVWTALGTPPSLGTGTLTGRFKRFGKWGIYDFVLTPSASTTFGTGSWRFSLPPGWTLLSTTRMAGYALSYDTSLVTTYVGIAFPTSTTTVEIRSHGLTAANNVTVPFTWATSDLQEVMGTVELV